MKQIKEEDHEPRMKVEKSMEVSLGDLDDNKKVLVGTWLTNEDRRLLVAFCKNQQDVFAWSHKEMSGIDLNYMCHELNIEKSYLLVKQKPQKFSPEKNKAINYQVDDVQNFVIQVLLLPSPWITL